MAERPDIKTVLLIAVLALAGCTQKLTATDLDFIAAACPNSGGVHHVQVSGTDWFYTTVVCKDKSAVTIIRHDDKAPTPTIREN